MIDVIWTDWEEKEYEVMAVVEIPSSLDLHSYSVNGVGVILPEEEFTRSYPQKESMWEAWITATALPKPIPWRKIRRNILSRLPVLMWSRSIR